ncbi:MAG: TrmH family RNA methyltransferase [Treponema sp.]|jgi:TrmH family RNA methyltransferase|nr:TrmH family RNA methyltransferase [Treponema sp.]
MIPLHKLKQLPRSQRLRKIAKLFAEAEYRLSLGDAPSPENTAYLRDALALLAGGDGFSPAAREAINAAAHVLQTAASDETTSLGFALNTVRHILYAETGRQTADWDFIDHGGVLDGRKRRVFPGVRVYLEDIRSPYNVGAMFRSAESFGVEKLFLSPLCADPGHPRARRTAMGCVDILPWERLPAKPETAAPFDGPVFALETGGTDIARFPFPATALMIVGSEELGVSPEGLAKADASLGRVSIPTYGAKGSLNAAAAFAIALHSWAAALARA